LSIYFLVALLLLHGVLLWSGGHAFQNFQRPSARSPLLLVDCPLHKGSPSRRYLA